MDLKEAVVIVTGAAGVMGSSLVTAFLRAGAYVFCLDVDGDAARAAAAGDPHAIPLQVDVTSVADVRRAVEQTLEHFGRIDVLINNAATFRAVGAVWEVEPDLWWRDVETNLYGPFLLCHEVVPEMIAENHGVIVNVSGGGFGSSVPGGSGYTGSKIALIRLTQTLALELSDVPSELGVRGDGYDITVYGIEPAFVAGAMNTGVATSAGGRRWLPFVGDRLARGETRDASDVGEAVLELVRIQPRELNGLTFGYEDDLRGLVRHATDLRAAGMCQVRYVPPTLR